MTIRRGRPPAYDREQALQAIIEAFLDGGYSGTSLDDLARVTGMNRPSLFAAFGNKRAMYAAALTAYGESMVAGVMTKLEERLDLRDCLEAFFQAAIRFYGDGPSRGCLILCTATVEAPADEGIAAILATALKEIERHFCNTLERSDDGGNPERLSGRAKLLTALLISIAVQSRTGASPEALMQQVNAALSALF